MDRDNEEDGRQMLEPEPFQEAESNDGDRKVSVQEYSQDAENSDDDDKEDDSSGAGAGDGTTASGKRGWTDYLLGSTPDLRWPLADCWRLNPGAVRARSSSFERTLAIHTYYKW